MLQQVLKPIGIFLIFSFLLLDFSAQTAKAQMIGTDTVVAAKKQDADRELIVAFLARDDVRTVMVQGGVDLAEAQKRVASLSDAEVATVSKAIDELPAGGDGLGTVVSAALFIFLLLLITDLLGLTHVYPFVNHRR